MRNCRRPPFPNRGPQPATVSLFRYDLYRDTKVATAKCVCRKTFRDTARIERSGQADISLDDLLTLDDPELRHIVQNTIISIHFADLFWAFEQEQEAPARRQFFMSKQLGASMDEVPRLLK